MSGDPFWVDQDRCNGILLDKVTADAAGDLGGCVAVLIEELGQLADALGGPNNVVASSLTGGNNPVRSDNIQIQSPNLTLPNNRFLAASVDVGAKNCASFGVQPPLHRFVLSVPGAETSLGPALNVCDGVTVSTPVTGNIVSPNPVRWVDGTSGNLQLLNDQWEGSGNDTAVDNLRLIDVTPTLTKEFETPVIAGQPATLTFTITNTTDLLPKPDMAFTDTFQSGLIIYPGSTATSTCGDAAAVLSSGSVAISGADLALNEARCTISVEVTAADNTYTNAASNFTGLEFVQVPSDLSEIVVFTAPEANNGTTAVIASQPVVYNVDTENSDFVDGDNSYTVEAGGTATGATIGTSGNVTWDSTGQTPGDYTVNYEICNNIVTPSVCDTATLTITVTASPSLSVAKTVLSESFSSPLAANDTVTYQFVIENTGDQIITGVSPVDAGPDFDGVDGTNALGAFTITAGDADLAPDETVTFTATYILSADDAAEVTGTANPATAIVNSATASGTPASGTLATVTPNGATTGITSDPALSVAKTVLNESFSSPLAANDTVTYQFVIENTGNVDITGVSPVDAGPAFDGVDGTNALGAFSITNGDADLAPGETVTFTAAYTLSAADAVEAAGAIDLATSIVNSATATGTPASSTLPDVTPSEVTTGIAGRPSLTLTNTLTNADDQIVDTLNEVIEYTIVVSNTGNIDLNNVDLTDTMSSGPTLPLGAPSGDSIDPGVLNVGETWTYTVDYTVTQDDLDDGSNLVNLASVTTDEVTQAVEDTATSAVQYVDIEVIEEILEEDLIQTTTILSQGVSNISRRAADRLKATKDYSCGEEINDLLTATPVQFATDKFFIDARNNALLDELTLILSECGNSSFMIAGHTDSDASDAYNLTLSQNRVDAVKAALVRRGIVGDRLQTRGFGESRPIATNATAEGKALNRRVEFILLDEVAPAGQKCGDDAQLTRNVDGSANDVGGSLNGNFASSGHNCVNGMYSETWGELSVTHDDDRGTVGVATFGMSREAQADGTLRGRFIEGYLSRNNVDSVDVSGAITGVGVHAGLYGAHATDAGLILSYYGSAAVGQHAFELNAGADVDGSYTHGAIFVGGAVGGVTEMAAMTVKPRLGIDLAYAAVIGSEISALSDTLDIDPVTVARGFVEIGFTQDVDNGTFSGAPRLFCEVNQDADACGFGAAFDYETLQNADGTLWSVGLDYEMIDNRQSASLKVAHAREIFDDLGVSRSSFGATATGALQAEQTIAFTW